MQIRCVITFSAQHLSAAHRSIFFQGSDVHTEEGQSSSPQTRCWSDAVAGRPNQGDIATHAFGHIVVDGKGFSCEPIG